MGRLVEPIPGIKTKIKNYFSLAEEIHKYFGYKEDWVCIPMDEQLDQHWMVTDEGPGGKLVHSSKPFTEESVKAGSDIYGGTIYTQRFLPKWVYRGEELTMVCVDTHTDGNKFLMIFDNKKECNDEYLKKLYVETWGKL